MWTTVEQQKMPCLFSHLSEAELNKTGRSYYITPTVEAGLKHTLT